MNSDEYERRVGALISMIPDILAVSGLQPVAEPTWGRANRIMGKSGFEHQIDVSCLCVDGHCSCQHLLLIECKKWASPITPGAVLAFAARKLDIQAANENRKVTAYLFTPNQPSSGGTLLAQYYGIALHTYRENNTWNINLERKYGGGEFSLAAVIAPVKDCPSPL